MINNIFLFSSLHFEGCISVLVVDTAQNIPYRPWTRVYKLMDMVWDCEHINVPDPFTKGRRPWIIGDHKKKCILPLLHNVNLSVGCLVIKEGVGERKFNLLLMVKHQWRCRVSIPVPLAC